MLLQVYVINDNNRCPSWSTYTGINFGQIMVGTLITLDVITWIAKPIPWKVHHQIPFYLMLGRLAKVVVTLIIHCLYHGWACCLMTHHTSTSINILSMLHIHIFSREISIYSLDSWHSPFWIHVLEGCSLVFLRCFSHSLSLMQISLFSVFQQLGIFLQANCMCVEYKSLWF